MVSLCLASLVLGACTGGGTTGTTWFNLPSVVVRVGNDGDSLRALGVTVGSLSAFGVKDVTDLLVNGGVETVEMRLGYNGIHVYVDGDDLPYIYWDQESAAALAGLVDQMGVGLPVSADRLFAWVRRVGVGVRVSFAEGSPSYRWSGETDFTPIETPSDVIGPLHLGGIAFDDAGALAIHGVDLAALGVPPLLDEDTRGLLAQLGIETARVSTTPNTLDIALNDTALPGLAYDEGSLTAGVNFARLLLADDPDTLELVETFLPRLPTLELTIDLSFTGAPVGETQLVPLTVGVTEDGALNVLGLPVVGAELPANILDTLQQADIQRLDVRLSGESIALAANGTVLPTVAIETSGLQVIDGLIDGGGMLPDAVALVETLTGAEPLALTLTLPGDASEGDANPLAAHTVEPVVLEAGLVPFLRIDVETEDGRLTAIGGVPAFVLGLGDVVLPDALLDLADSAGLASLTLKTSANTMDILADEQSLIALQYDEESLGALLNLLPAVMEDGNMNEFLAFAESSLVPLFVGSDIELVLHLN